MADALTELLGLMERQSDLVSQIVENSEASLQNKNVIGSPNSTFKNQGASTLNSAEKKKVHQISDIFITDFFNEQKKRQKDTAEKTKIDKIAQPLGQKTKDLNIKDKLPKEKGGLLDNIMDWVMGYLGLKKISDLLSKSRDFVKRILDKIKGPLKAVGRFLWKAIKAPFKLAKKFIYDPIVGIVKKLPQLFDDAFRVLKTSIRSVGRFLKKALFAPFKLIKKFLYTPLIGAGERLLNYLKESTLIKKITEVFDNVAGFFNKHIDALKSKIDELVEGVLNKVKSILPKGLADKLPKVGGSAKGAAEGASKSIFSRIGGGLSKGASFIGGGISKGASFVGGGISKGVGAVKGEAVELAQAGITKLAKGALKGAGGAFKLIGKAAGPLKRIPVLGLLIESLFTAKDIMDMKEKYLKGDLTEEDLQKQAGKRFVEGLTGLLGGAGGAAVGGVLGSFIPVAGNFIGALVGGMAGDALGRFAGGLITDYLLPPSAIKSVGAYITGTNPPKEEMQDFIFSRGRAYPFSSKDEIVGMKQGGPADKLLSSSNRQIVETEKLTVNAQKLSLENFVMNPMDKGNSLHSTRDKSMDGLLDQQGRMNEHMKAIGATNSIMIEYLKNIAQNTAIIAQGARQNMTTKVNPPTIPTGASPNSFQKYNTNLTDNRSSYARSAYALE